MDNNLRKEALLRMKGQESFDPVAFDDEAQMRVARLKEAMQKGQVSPDMGDSEDSPMRDPDAANLQKLQELKAYLGAEGREPASEEDIPQSRIESMIPEGTDDDMARKMLMLKMLKDRAK